VAQTVSGIPTSLNIGTWDEELLVSWVAPTDDGGSDIVDYVVEYTSSGASSWTTFDDGTGTSTSAVVDGLTNGTQYQFRVSAKNGVGTSDPSATAAGMPISLAVTGTDETSGINQIQLFWVEATGTPDDANFQLGVNTVGGSIETVNLLFPTTGDDFFDPILMENKDSYGNNNTMFACSTNYYFHIRLVRGSQTTSWESPNGWVRLLFC